MNESMSATHSMTYLHFRKQTSIMVSDIVPTARIAASRTCRQWNSDDALTTNIYELETLNEDNEFDAYKPSTNFLSPLLYTV